MAWYGGYSGGQIEDVLSKAEQAGIFAYVLPFLLIFALVNGILTRMGLFNENKAINPIISFVVGLLALQFGFVSSFFAEIFPRLGIGLIIILVILIIVGLFVDPTKPGIMIALLVIAAVIVAVILVQSSIAEGSSVGYWFQQHWVTIVWIVVIITVIAIIAGASSGREPKEYKAIWPYGIPTK